MPAYSIAASSAAELAAAATAAAAAAAPPFGFLAFLVVEEEESAALVVLVFMRSRMARLPRFEVMMSSTLVKSMVRPLLSVRRPSSKICNKI